MALLFVFPIYWAFSQSLRNPLDTFTVAGFGIPWVNFTPTLDNWIDQLSTPETVQALAQQHHHRGLAPRCSRWLLGTPAAYALARFRFERWQNRDITVWFLSQRVLPPVATVIPFYLTMRWLGLLDTHLALILINATFVLPFVVVILRQTFLDLPVELEEAALVDGAGHFGRLLADRAAARRTVDGRHRPHHLRLHLERVPVRGRRSAASARSPCRSTSPAPSIRAACSSGSWACAR